MNVGNITWVIVGLLAMIGLGRLLLRQQRRIVSLGQGQLLPRARAAFQAGLQRSTIQDRGRRLRVLALGQAQQHT
jgi:hypothetical protein